MDVLVLPGYCTATELSVHQGDVGRVTEFCRVNQRGEVQMVNGMIGELYHQISIHRYTFVDFILYSILLGIVCSYCCLCCHCR